MPNQPKNKARTIRVPDVLWEAAQATADERGENLSVEIRAFLRKYAKANLKGANADG